MNTALTPRRCEALRLYMAGYEQKQIAAIMGISRHTVKNHLDQLQFKLFLKDRYELRTYAHFMSLDSEQEVAS